MMNEEQEKLLNKVFEKYADELDMNLAERAINDKEIKDAWLEFEDLKQKTFKAFEGDGDA